MSLKTLVILTLAAMAVFAGLTYEKAKSENRHSIRHALEMDL